MTSEEFAAALTPRVKQVVRQRRPLVSIAWMPIIGMIVRIVLQLLPLLMAQPSPGAAEPGDASPWPWRDDPDEVPPDVLRAGLAPMDRA